MERSTKKAGRLRPNRDCKTCVHCCVCMKLYGTKLLLKSRRTRLKRRLIIIFVSLKNCAFMENLNSDININVIWSCTIMKLIYWGLTLRFTASSAIKCQERKGKENKMKWNEHDDSSSTWLYMAVRFGLPESDTHLTDSSIAQSQHPARFKASRDFAPSSSKRVARSWGFPYTLYICTICIHVLACVSLCTQQTWYGATAN